MSIDWSKAPEGATHWEPTGLEFNERWMKKEGNGWFFWGLGAEWKYGGDVSAEREATFEARPQEAWDGQGLPPVGLMVEWKAGLDHDWQRVTVLAYANGDAWFQPEDGPSFIVGNPANFRRIRTPEQLAAEEREKAINQMISDAGYVDPKIGTFVAMRNLYDAGYRRREEGK